jgi:hypothetical protein
MNRENRDRRRGNEFHDNDVNELVYIIEGKIDECDGYEG